MAEQPKRGDTPAADGKSADGAKSAGGLLTKLPVLLGGVMVLEAVVLFGAFKLLGGSPTPASGADLAVDDGDPHAHGSGTGGHGGGDASSTAGASKNRSVEINVVNFKAPNKLSGRTFLYDVSIYVVVKSIDAERVKQVIKDREALIQDRIRTIIAQSDPEKLGGGSEPGLETLRRQVKYQLDEIVGDGQIAEVLVPRCIPFRTDY
jgi:flagellar basal body-associated protein FliL